MNIPVKSVVAELFKRSAKGTAVERRICRKVIVETAPTIPYAQLDGAMSGNLEISVVGENVVIGSEIKREKKIRAKKATTVAS